MHHHRPTRRRFAALIGTALIACAVAPTSWAQTPANAADAFLSAFRQLDQATHGDNHAAGAAAEQFTALSAAHPADPVLRAYAGSATALLATTTWQPWKKLSYAEDGLAQIDKALAQLTANHDAPAWRQVPASLETRFVAANTFLKLPAMFNRNVRGNQLLESVLTSPLLTQAPLPFKGTVWMLAAGTASAAQRPADARRWLEQVVSSGAPQSEAAKQQLGTLGS